MIPLLGLSTLVRKRQSSDPLAVGANFLPRAAVYTSLTFRGSVQAMPETTRELLPDGQRQAEAVLIATYTELRTASENGAWMADRVTLPGGEEYEVIHVQRSPAFLIQPVSYVASAVRVQVYGPPRDAAA